MTFHHINGIKVRTGREFSLWKGMDWSAVDDRHDENGIAGFGATEQEAIADLLEQIEERFA